MPNHLYFLIFVIFLTSGQTYAQKAKGTGISFNAAFGLPSASIENPDGSKAFYSGLSLTGRVHLPLVESEFFKWDLVGGIRYFDLNNNINSKLQKELGQHIGPGAGTELRFFRFVLGYEYYFMVARHYTVGQFSESLEYKMPLTNIYGGINYQFGQLAVQFTYSQANGKVPKTETKFATDSPYQDQTYWLHLKYSTGYSFFNFLSTLFK